MLDGSGAVAFLDAGSLGTVALELAIVEAVARLARDGCVLTVYSSHAAAEPVVRRVCDRLGLEHVASFHHPGNAARAAGVTFTIRRAPPT